MEKIKNKKPKLIFLDYDGVVNNLVFHTIDGEPLSIQKLGKKGVARY